MMSLVSWSRVRSGKDTANIGGEPPVVAYFEPREVIRTAGGLRKRLEEQWEHGMHASSWLAVEEVSCGRFRRFMSS